MELSDLKMFDYLNDVDSSLANQVNDVYVLTLETINSISKSFSNYTMHDMNHGLRVASYMEQLAFGINEDFKDRISEFNPFEIALMLLSSILHDIGMTIREEDKEQIKTSDTIKYTKSLTYQGVLKVCGNNEEEAIKEIIRRTHAARIEEFINYEFGGMNKTKIYDKLAIEGKYNYSTDIVNICRAHGEDYSYLREMRSTAAKGNYSYNPQYIAVLLRIADYLDIDQQRTPMLWYSSMGINGFSKEEWEKHFIIQNTTKLKTYIDNKLQIFFDGRSSNAKIHRKYLAYIDKLKCELENADNLLNTTSTMDKYKFRISTKIDDMVYTDGFTYSDLRLNLDYSSITELLMGKNIYGDNRLGLRELVQNAIDACQLMKEASIDDNDIFHMDPAIQISCSKKDNYIKIRDNGIGMTLDVVKKHFLNVGKSYYKSDDFQFKNNKYIPIGQYGIGFLACFLLSNNVTVKTKYFDQSEVSQIELEKNSEYVVTTSQATPNFFGTEITLDYDIFMENFVSFEEIDKFLSLYFNTKIPINLNNVDESKNLYIKNYELNIIEDYLKKESNNYCSINLSKYSDALNGTVFLEGYKSIELKQLSDSVERNYYYDSNTESIIKCNDQIFNDGIYRLIEYPNLTANEVKKVLKNANTYNEAREEAIKLANSKNNLINILFKPEDLNIIYDGYYLEVEDNKNKDIKKIFDKSNLFFYKEFPYLSSSKTIFIHEQLFSKLSHTAFDDRLYYHREDKYNDLHKTLLYYKGIYVPRCSKIYLITPYDIENLLGLINCDDISLKLDVSRNTIIEGENLLRSELTKAVLLYSIDMIAGNEMEKKFIKALINYNHKEQ